MGKAGEVREPIVVSYGGGTNSTAMLIEMHRRGIRPDLILFADTGSEMPHTYAFVRLFQEWLAANAIPPITTVRRECEHESLYAECIARKTLPALAFGFRSCSDQWKIRPQNRYLAAWEPAVNAWAMSKPVAKAVGFDTGEVHRMADYDGKRYRVWLPLVEFDMDRDDCERAIIDAGLPLPGKSSCWFCPAMKKHEVLALKREQPCLYAKACAMEANADGLTEVKGLGRNWSWAALGDADERQLKLFPEAPAMPCMCED
jgi:hypothetical protein